MYRMPPAKPESKPGSVITVLFFDQLADAFGFSRRIEIPAAGCALSTVRRLLADAVDGGRGALAREGVRSAVDKVMSCGREVWVRPGQEVAFFSLIAPQDAAS